MGKTKRPCSFASKAGQTRTRFELQCSNVGRFTCAEYPKAHALAHFEAAHREALTTLFRASLPIEPAAAALLWAADGSRSLEELEAEPGKAITQHALALAARFELLRPESASRLGG
jgi:hypothetical protein